MNIPRTCGIAVQENDMTIERVLEPSVSSRSKFIRKFAEGLDDDERHCVILRYLHGLSVSEIAEVVNCSERLVESLFRGIDLRFRELKKQESSALEQTIPVS